MRLHVRPLKRKDAGSGLAAIDRDALEEVSPESTAEFEGGPSASEFGGVLEGGESETEAE
ncbi:hypothetical protein Htur_1010 [Haloterrigena turkmenica DSM 5511]|uniref:Uncharacterized protein n=1 Tax=Haloterrigena turkmenica (strain ATCC 51198 / DSM 5511 / JCM 9101 / NCIMB 13204 / VKM B-1734 / 4k) TaxID=543526 RepID=D2RYK3_HALTV|nr:hypothetical protein [Haloterrigena turkmenica]ADB59904.1 hypothetical protein Htur_1010 [Haloterrigena turkmenica DSM 5511]